MRRLVAASLLLAGVLVVSRLGAQETAPAAETPPPAPPGSSLPDPAPEPAKKEPLVYRPIEGPIIINLPSVDVPKKGTLSVLFAHRFSQPVQGSSINDLFSFDSPANIGIGLGYAPVKNFALFFYRYSNENITYELSGKYSLFSCGPLAVSLGAGGDFRTKPSPPPPFAPVGNRSTFFAQAILAYTPFPWLRITAEPMYLNHTSGQDRYSFGGYVGDQPATFLVDPEAFYANVFNVPLAASVAVTTSIMVHGEVVPSYGRTVVVRQAGCETCAGVPTHSSPGVGWVVSVEKTLVRHRFAFMAGNMRETTTDQFLLPNFRGNPKNIYLGFYLTRQWGIGH